MQVARETGALAVLPLALIYRSGTHLHAGEFAATSALIEDADALARSIGGAPLMYTKVLLAAWRGEQAAAIDLIEAGLADATPRGEGRALTWAEYASALLHNGLGEYEAALAAARAACEHDDLGLVAWALVELVEAAARCDRPDIAAATVERLAERTQASGTDWALGIEARSHALLSDGEEADGLYREAVERLARTRVTVHLARAHLVYGEWLRREQRRSDARDHLRAAHDMFDRFGAEGFAERARRELLATGETVRRRTVETQDVLTPQETQVARLAAEGQTNPEIGAQLYISPRTAEYHLHKVFTKLAISSRRQLRGALDQLERPVPSGTPDPDRPTRDRLGASTEAIGPDRGTLLLSSPGRGAQPMNDHVLEPAAQEIADATSKPPFLYELGPDGARKVLDDIQAAPIDKLDVDERWVTVPAEVGDVRVRIVRPVGAVGALPTVLYVHGGGWVLGNAGTHDRLVRELAVGADAAVVFVEYDRSPEARYPVAIEQAYATARWIVRDGLAEGLDASAWRWPATRSAATWPPR